MIPPDRFSDASFDAYRPETPAQLAARDEAISFVKHLEAEHAAGWIDRLARMIRRPSVPMWKGLYLVGPVGTGKTHLLAAMYHALHPKVPCAFLHSSALFRTQTPPPQYAQQLANRYRVLCLDEIELDDAANEARLILTLKALEKRGVMLLATSNVEPERFLSAAFGGDRFRRFLNEEFRSHYKVVLIGGDDYRKRLPKTGRAWIGDPLHTEAYLQAAYESAPAPKRRLTFNELLVASTETEHTRLVEHLASPEYLFLSDIEITSTDDALRLLRLIDDLYLQPQPPTLYFSARKAPDEWFVAETARQGLEQGIAEKFKRTVSRLHALCQIEEVSL